MPQMAPSWWLIVQLSVILLFMVVFVEIYYSFSLSEKEVKTFPLGKHNLSSKFSLKSLLNE